MKIVPLDIPDLLLIEPCILEDERGFFFESFRQDVFKKVASLSVSFVQENYSKSFKNVLRGLHYQLPPHAQGKLISVIQGEILDVALDLRQSSLTFGKYVLQVLSEKDRKQLWIPEGFAHGYLVTSDIAEVCYKTTDYYHPDYESSILWNDHDLKINWPLEGMPLLSLKDKNGQPFSKALLSINIDIKLESNFSI
jgi:dTDP-4-dehydrorhamnose 3,5-epimerase